MNDQILPSGMYTRINNNKVDEKDYNFDNEINDNLRWGDQFATTFFRNITKPSYVVDEGDFNYFFNLKNNYVEMPRTPNAKKQGLHKFE